VGDPIEDYIRANRNRYGRAYLTGQLVVAGHERAAIDAAWDRVSQERPQPASGSTAMIVLVVVLITVVLFVLWQASQITV
jgi:hypothetical protein